MTTQTELQLESALIAQVQGVGYGFGTIKTEADLMANLKQHIEKATPQRKKDLLQQMFV